jgi:ATP-dependent Lon protease
MCANATLAVRRKTGACRRSHPDAAAARHLALMTPFPGRPWGWLVLTGWEVALPTAQPQIPIAQIRSFARVAEVEKRLDKLPARDHESLRRHERMLERGPQRMLEKPPGVPAMDHFTMNCPHTAPDDSSASSPCADSRDGLELTPLLLLGPPGIGKTHFARRIAQLLGTGLGFVSMSSLTAGWVLSGASSQWKGARPGKIFETLVDGAYANPVVVVDEIDKARAEHAYDPLGALYGLLEHDTAGCFVDEFADVSIDASQVIWVASANDESAIPEPILNRMNVFEVRSPDHDAARTIALRLYRGIRAEHDWGQRFDDAPAGEVLERMASLAPREMRRAWMTAFGNARLAGRGTLQLDDLPDTGQRRTPIGFGH